MIRRIIELSALKRGNRLRAYSHYHHSKNKTLAIQIMKAGLFLLLMAGFISSCSPKSTPPGASTIGGSAGDTLYSYHYWKEGLAILIWHDFGYGESGCGGSSSTEDPVYRLNCDVEARDGRRFSWEVHSSDGQTAEMWIDGEAFNLSQGNLFLVSSEDGETEVVQLQRDFSTLEPSNETISALATSDSDIADFVARAKSQFPPAAGITDTTPSVASAITDDKCPKGFAVLESPPEITQPTDTLLASLKGYVLQSHCWDGEWYFTLEVGLNAKQPCTERSFDDAATGLSYTVKGTEALLMLLDQIPPGAYVSWCGFEEIPDQDRMPGPEMTAAAASPDGSLWYAFDNFDAIGGSPPGSQNQGLFRLKGGFVSHFDVPAPIRVLEVEPDGSLYVGAGCGVLRYANESMDTLLEIDCERETSVTKLRPLTIAFAEDGTVWIGGAFSLASYDGEAWTEYDIPAARVTLASDGTVWTRGWDGRADSNCCLTHITGPQWVTYTWTSDVPAEPAVLQSLLEQLER